MLKPLTKLTNLAILSLMLVSQASLAADPPKIDLSCLSRPQKEAIDICFKENASCHTTLQTVEKPPDPVSSWKNVALYIAAGVLAGMITEHQLQK